MFAKRISIFAAVLVVVLIAGATWAFANGGSDTIHACVHQSNGNIRIVTEGTECKNSETPLSWSAGQGQGGGGGSTFPWYGDAHVLADLCYGLGGAGCDLDTLSGKILLPSDGELTALAIRPLVNTSTKPARITVLVNGNDTELTVEIPANSTAFVVNRTPLLVHAGDLIVFKTHALYLPGEEIPTLPYPGPYPGPGGLPPSFRYWGSVEYRSN